MIAVGLYAGLDAYRAPAKGVDRDVVEVPAELVVSKERLLTEEIEAQEFRYLPGSEGRYALNFRQVNSFTDPTGQERALETRMGLGFEQRVMGDAGDEEREAVEGAVLLDRIFEEVRIDLIEGEARVGVDITRQLELLLADGGQAVLIEAHGPILEMAWTSDTNPQIRQTLLLIHDGLDLVHPHLRFDRVLVGESWTYRIASRLLVSEDEVLADARGELVIHNRFDGFVETPEGELAVLSQTFELGFGGGLGEEGREFEARGEGKGKVLFDVNRGRVVASRLSMERETSFGGREESVLSRVELLLIEEGVSLGDMLR